MSSVAVRAATVADLPSIVDFEIDIARISFADDAVIDRAVHEKRLRKVVAAGDDGALVAVDSDAGDGEVIGWAWVALRTNFVTEEVYATLRSLATRGPRATEAGELLGAAAIAFAEEHGVRAIVGRVHIANVPMRALYKKLGFEVEHLTVTREISGRG